MIKYGMALVGQSVTTDAISNLQKRAGINVTGVLDTETKKLLVIPRCGVTEDVYNDQEYGKEKGITERRRRKRFTLQGSTWKKNVSVATQADLATERERQLPTRNPAERTKRDLPLCHWSSQLFHLRAPSSTDVPVLLLNQPETHDAERASLLYPCNAISSDQLFSGRFSREF